MKPFEASFYTFALSTTFKELKKETLYNIYLVGYYRILFIY